LPPPRLETARARPGAAGRPSTGQPAGGGELWTRGAAPRPAGPATALVRLAPGVGSAALAASPRFAGFKVKDELALGDRALVEVALPAGLAFGAARARLLAVPGVQTVMENAERHPLGFDFTDRDPRLGEQWAHLPTRSDTEPAWSLVPAAQQSQVIVAVLDTGLDVDHPEFAGRVVAPRDMTGDEASDPTDVHDVQQHGTHCAGIVGAAGDNGVGVAGVAWGVKIMPVKVLGDSGFGSDFGILMGMLYAIRYRPEPDDGSRVRVLSMSLGAESGSVNALYEEVIQEARAAGIVVVIAAGNSGHEFVGSPASAPSAVCVGSTADYMLWERLSQFSNFGDQLDVTAPGSDILSTVPKPVGGSYDEAYASFSGTSMACPYVAGLAALITARYDPTNGRMDAAWVDALQARLADSADDLGDPGRDPLYGSGRVNAARAVAPATL
jgi:subtilisin family serine protease